MHRFQDSKEPMAKNKIEIIHEDSEIIVVNKPPGISVTADRSGTEDLLPILTRQLQPKEELRPVHRLDKSTSGAMIIAKTPEAQSQYASWFEKRIIKKKFLALVTGYVARKTRTIKTPIAHSRKNPRIMILDSKRGTPCLTHYKLLADFGLVALLAVVPETIRTHQIRIHLASVNLPLTIDPLYGGTRPILLSDIKPGYIHKREKPESPLIERLTLHAYQLEVPTENAPSAIYIAKMEKKFTATVKMLTKHNPKGPDAFEDPSDLEKILNSNPI